MSYTTYSKVGPFVDNGAPGVDHNFLNAIETFLASGWFDSLITSDHAGKLSAQSFVAAGSSAFAPNMPGVPVTGTTAGTATLYQFLTGTIKAFVVYFSGYRNASVTEQTVSLPTPFTTYALFLVGASKSIRPYSGGTALSNKVNVVSTISNGSGPGTATLGNITQGYSYGDIVSGFDAVGLGANESTTTTGLTLVLGI